MSKHFFRQYGEDLEQVLLQYLVAVTVKNCKNDLTLECLRILFAFVESS